MMHCLSQAQCMVLRLAMGTGVIHSEGMKFASDRRRWTMKEVLAVGLEIMKSSPAPRGQEPRIIPPLGPGLIKSSTPSRVSTAVILPTPPVTPPSRSHPPSTHTAATLLESIHAGTPTRHGTLLRSLVESLPPLIVSKMTESMEDWTLELGEYCLKINPPITQLGQGHVKAVRSTYQAILRIVGDKTRPCKTSAEREYEQKLYARRLGLVFGHNDKYAQRLPFLT